MDERQADGGYAPGPGVRCMECKAEHWPPVAVPKLPPITGWASAALHIQAQAERIAALETDSHPPIDLGPAIDEILAERGYHQAGVCHPGKQTPEIEDLLRACRATMQLDLDEILVGNGVIADIHTIPDMETIDNRAAYRRARSLKALLVQIDKTLGTHIGEVADV